MLDINLIRENPDVIKEAARKKRVLVDIDRLLELDVQRRAYIQNVDALRAEQNRVGENIAQASNEEREERIVAMRALKEKLNAEEKALKQVEEEYMRLMLLAPNIPDLSVPDGESDADNKEVRTGGTIPEFSFEPKGHVALMQKLGLVDFERGAKVSGFRGYFLKGDAVTLSFALWSYACSKLQSKGFLMHTAPALVRGVTLIGTGWLPQGKDEVYKVEDDLYLAGTAEVPIMGMYEDELLDEKNLPITVAAFSPCFRSEAGSHGKDAKGLYRVHEFIKIEQVVLCRADHEESVNWHEKLTQNAEEILQELELPYRVVVNCGADLGLGQVKKYDIETWIPSQKKYGETHSSSYFHDFQTRRLNIRYRDKDGKLRFAHSLNNTMIATPRILISLLENNQQEDGSITIPKVLQAYVGKEKISQNLG